MREIKYAIELVKEHLTKTTNTNFFIKGFQKLRANKLQKLIKALESLDQNKFVPESKGTEDKREVCLATLNQIISTLLASKDCSLSLQTLLKSINEIIEENLAYYSEGKIYLYWRGPQAVYDAPPGIAVLVNDSRPKSKQIYPYPTDFKEKVISSLEHFYKMPSGKKLLDELLSKSSRWYEAEKSKTKEQVINPEAVFILPADPTKGNNINASIQDSSLQSVAYELREQYLSFPKHTQEALDLVEKQLKITDKFQWLAERINLSPKFTLVAIPSDTPFLTEVKITGKDIEDWFTNKYFYMKNKFGDEVFEHILNATIAALQDFSQPREGCGSIIRWNYSPNYHKNKERPPMIGLFHELVHAYYSAKGMQPGYQDQMTDTVILFEYITVGLGPWRDTKVAQMSENLIREEWNECLNHIPKEDTLNHVSVMPREYYTLDPVNSAAPLGSEPQLAVEDSSKRQKRF